MKIRKNVGVQAQLEGNMYVKFESYNSGGGVGGYSSESSMSFCPGGKLFMYSQSFTTVNVEGTDGSGVNEESDEGTFDVYEDQKGNLFLKIRLRKGGEGFIHFAINGGKLLLEGGESFIQRAGDC